MAEMVALLCSVKLTKEESVDDEKKTEIEDHEPLEVDSLSYKADGQGFKLFSLLPRRRLSRKFVRFPRDWT